MNTDNVGSSNRFRRGHQLDTQLCRALTCQTPAPRNHRHAKRTRPRNHLPDFADADQTKRPSKQTTRFGKLLLVPRALSQGDYVVRDATIERENQGKGELGNGDRIFPRTIGNVDPAF